MSVSSPLRVAAAASAAVTVVLPTPPLPATITTREVEQNCSKSMPQDATKLPRGHRMRRLLVVLGASAMVATAALALGPASPRAGAASRGGIVVVQVEGYFDPPNQDLMLDAISNANAQHTTALVFQV